MGGGTGELAAEHFHRDAPVDEDDEDKTLPKGERYSMGLPNDAWRTMCEVWSRAPSSERIIEDIDRFKKAVERIIAAEGCYVEEYDARHGHRKSMQKAVNGGGVQHFGGEYADREGDGGDEGACVVVGGAN